MGVYSGVYEYTQQIQEQIRSIQSIQVFVHLLSCRQDPCSIIKQLTNKKQKKYRAIFSREPSRLAAQPKDCSASGKSMALLEKPSQKNSLNPAISKRGLEFKNHSKGCKLSLV